MLNVTNGKFGAKTPFNLILVGVGFGAFYWVMESVRDVIVFERGDILEQLFSPDSMTFWMRFLAVLILVGFGARAEVLRIKAQKQPKEQLRRFNFGSIASAGLVFGALYWILESFRDSFVFGKGNFIERLVNPDPIGFWMRLLAIFILILFSLYAQAYINERRRIEKDLQKKHDAMEKLVRERTVELSKSNELLQKEVVERTHVEDELRKVNRALKTLSAGNKALVRVTEELALLKDVCDIIVKVGGYRFAWVGFSEPDKKNGIKPISQCGFNKASFKSTHFSWNSDEHTQNPFQQALETRKPAVLQQDNSSIDLTPWLKEASQEGCKSVISLPLICDNAIFGTLNIHTEDLNAFNKEEVNLLEELAYDLAFGINVLRGREAYKQTQETLEESEEKYKTLTENINVGIFRSTPGTEGKFIKVNPALVRIFGYDDERSLQEKMFSEIYLHSSDQNRFDQKMEKYGFVKDEHLQLKKKDGSAIWGMMTAVAVHDDSGNIECYDGIVEDITERKELEEEIERRRRYLESVLKQAPDGIVTYSSSEKVIEWNPGAEQIFGYKAREAIGRNIVDLITKADVREEAKRLTQSALAGEKIPPFETIRYNKNGDPIHVIVAMSQIHLDEELYGIVVIYTDITAHKMAQEEKEIIQAQLNQAQKMEAIGILAGGIAHDFNNLLTAIQVSTDLAIMQVDEADTLHEDLREVHKLTERASSLIRQLLLFSRKHPMEYATLNLNQIFENLQKMLLRLIGEDIKTQTNLESELWSVKADQSTMEQVIMNLVINARDAMANGGNLLVQSENMVLSDADCKHITEAQPGRCVCLSITDTGTGIEGKTLEHIFEPFFSTKGVGKGTGLGLSVVYGIIKQHKGWIHVETKENLGSTFKVYLPAVSEEIDQIEESKVFLRKDQGDGRRILLVEDEEKVREFTTSGLNRSGYKVFTASTAEDAKKIFKKEKGNFDLVLSDVVLPDQNGLEMVDEFINHNPDLQVLLSSGYTDHKSRWPDIKSKGYRFLEKPYTLSDLLRVINEVVEKV